MILRRCIAAVTLSALACVWAGGAWAGGYVTLGCGDWQEEFMVGTGRQFRGQGLELWPMVCLSTGKMSTYARVMNPEHFARLQTLAAQSAPDSERVADWIAAHADEAVLMIAPDMFGQIEGLTFGDIRSTAANAARPTEESILTSPFVYYIHPNCTGRLVPFDYYLERMEPCPACKGGKLDVIDSGNHAEWE
ncbi:hypothetical protein [Telmatospirillum siberiense]|uniref:Uncharacterized protein n=1 Tax=Telmatospirillum siberiense TaxID=382514 RepID=A0A2N3PMM6_9PROT|nr:hypothetical protein [Telmatospirillum siberiense]PKU21643.1 hypothetical protein CWS72_25595 [Telmatospirillum siberiense]